jgi:hypothetical protein
VLAVNSTDFKNMLYQTFFWQLQSIFINNAMGKHNPKRKVGVFVVIKIKAMLYGNIKPSCFG